MFSQAHSTLMITLTDGGFSSGIKAGVCCCCYSWKISRRSVHAFEMLTVHRNELRYLVSCVVFVSEDETRKRTEVTSAALNGSLDLICICVVTTNEH